MNYDLLMEEEIKRCGQGKTTEEKDCDGNVTGITVGSVESYHMAIQDQSGKAPTTVPTPSTVEA